MRIDKEIANELYKAKILLAHNVGAPIDNAYGWMTLPADIDFEQSITIEERVGLYGGPYHASTGAPNSHGLCSAGSFTYSYARLPAGLVVGRYCSISSGLTFLDSHHQTHLLTTSALTFRPHNDLWRDLLATTGVPQDQSWHIYDHKIFPVIGNDVWIGRDVTLAMGITIGDGAVIAAKSVVTKDVPPYTIVGGSPATVLRGRFPNEIALRLQVSKWWNKAPEFVARIASLGVEDALRHLDDFGGSVKPFEPVTVTLNNAGLQVHEPAQLAMA
jgi:virginiamycin A acetyltransferase